MNWFTQICRNLGLMVHNIRHPEAPESQTKVIRKEMEEEKRGKMILRRTTIEEVEIRSETPENKNSE